MEWSQRAADRIRSWGAAQELTDFADIAVGLATRLQAMEKQYVGTLPWQLVHGDFWDNNVFFRDGNVVLVTDLDFMGVRPRIDDLALTLYYTNSSFSDDQLSRKRIQRLKCLVDAYDSRLAEPLTLTERSVLPLAIVRTPLFMMRYIALMESYAVAAQPMAATLPDLRLGMKLLDDLESWQQVLLRCRLLKPLQIDMDPLRVPLRTGRCRST